MSAYVVSNNVIDFIISAFIENARHGKTITVPIDEIRYITYDLATDADRDALGQALLDENYRSVNHRYSESDNGGEYKFRFHRAVLDMSVENRTLQMAQSIACLDYQACECPDYHKSRCYLILNNLRDAALSKLMALKEDRKGRSPYKWGAPDHLPDGEGPISIMDMVTA